MMPYPPWIWEKDGALHFDAPMYAKARGIGVDEARAELKRLLRELLPEAKIDDVE